MLIVPTEKRFDWTHAPIVLMAIVLINILVFVLYQSSDTEKAYTALEGFVASGFVEKEWPIYEAYLQRQDRSDELALARQLARQNELYRMASVMMSEPDYFEYAIRTARFEFPHTEYDAWRNQREQWQATYRSMSAFEYGLIASDVSLTTLISHQFLHGGVGHILGNMIFLVLFGFAVEAAIGHWRFLLFYLLSGIASGMTQVAFTWGSEVPLVGASGAISGVMAMYLAVFRLRKIEFFYWVFFFVGYFRAPALLILPFYIGKEIYQYTTMDGSNVAFMAHAGGFVAGAILIVAALFFNRSILNETYVDEDQSASERDKALSQIYRAMEQLRFDYAGNLIQALMKKEGKDFELLALRYHVEKIKRGRNYWPVFRALMNQPAVGDDELSLTQRCFLEEPEATRRLPLDEQLQLAFRLTRLPRLEAATILFDHLYDQQYKPAELILLARKLANRFAEKQDNAQSVVYQERANALAAEGHHGLL